MNRKSMVILVKVALRKLSLDELHQIERLINSGQMMGVFEEALDKAIESKTVDEWQQENQIGM